MSSGLEYPANQHENMFFEKDHLAYAKTIKRDKEPDSKFEYNNVNSMLLSDILLRATGKNAKTLLKERIMDPTKVSSYSAWTDNAGNSLTYCCLDMSARDYARFGLLFSRNGKWEDKQLISEEFVKETFQQVWDLPPENGYQSERGYSMHWWISRFDEERKIFNASGKFGQYIFVDKEKDVVFVRITKYTPPPGDVQNLGFLYSLSFLGMDNVIALARLLIEWGFLNADENIISPATLEDGVSREFIRDYSQIIDYLTFLEDE
jgi:CubicO group peptidase (beta-lactamase class C family)